MMRCYLGRPKAVLKLCVLLIAVLAGRDLPRAFAANEQSATPHIAGARIGFNNHYKLGCWTAVTVDIDGLAGDATAKPLEINVEVADSDGIATTASVPVLPVASASERARAVVYTQVGRVGSPIKISLVEGDESRDELTLLPTAKAGVEVAVNPISATCELIVSLGTKSFGLRDAFADRMATGDAVGRKVVELDSIRDLPVEWFGYAGVDVLVLAAGDGRLANELGNDRARVAALERWVELGGRLVIFCGARNAVAMLGPNGTIASWAPGKYAEVVKLPETGSIEHYAGSATGISGGLLEAPRLADARGSVELYVGRRASDLPLVVRTPRGFGEIAFVGLEFDEAPLNTWSGRTAFLRAVLKPYLPEAATADASQKLVMVGFNDLSGALRQRLGRSFPQVVPIGFPAIAGLAIAYLVLLGPIDYLVNQRLRWRALAGWITLPLLIGAFAAATVGIRQWSRGSAQTRVNQLELIDFDTIGRQVRGTFWAEVYSPDAKQFDFRFNPPTSLSGSGTAVETQFSWWGLPGLGIGGMQSGGDLGIVRVGYTYGESLAELNGVPVLTSATKALQARWSASSPPQLVVELNDVDGLVSGTVTNGTGATLRNARLLYGTWAYRLGNVAAGARVEVGEQLSPSWAKTIVTREALGETGPTQSEGGVFSAEQASAKDILNLMMFYETAGGFGFAHVPNRFQAYCDLSRELDLGRAVLVAEAAGPHSTLFDARTKMPLSDEGADGNLTFYRFVLPVNRTAEP